MVWFGGMIRGIVQGYDSHRSNFYPVLNLAHLKNEHVCMYMLNTFGLVRYVKAEFSHDYTNVVFVQYL